MFSWLRRLFHRHRAYTRDLRVSGFGVARIVSVECLDCGKTLYGTHGLALPVTWVTPPQGEHSE